ncbi:major facilitator superfamily protein [Haloterrigena salina JCM 13891]|uniref:Major facilitator superfamily protein n=1 Tax=Haloterrigena salina JCM 13891 TaxID=1227488 RepID=M0CDP1_9EURY|nr:MFS transporter [Haloterrigena salina]ELZ20472.1 major facilitator superfamily protein [Haloterrigena salina JCM 13891]
MTNDETERPDSRRSWLVAVAGAIGMVFTFGTPFSYGILRQPFSEAFAVSPVALSTVFSIMLFTFFIGAGAVGVFAARLPARPLLLACAAVTAAIAPALFLTGSYLGLSLVFALLGLALGTVYVLLASIIPRWFDERRGAATGLIFVGNGLGLALLPPIWQAVIARLGVRQGFAAVMAATAVAFLLAGIACRRPPWTDGATDSSGDVLEWIRRLARTRTFQLLFVGIALAFSWYQLLAAFAVDLFAARGLTAAGASTAFGLVGGVSIISRIGGGYLADRAGARRAFLASLVSAAAGVLLLFAPQFPVLAVGVFLLGIGLGGTATLYIPLLMGIYGADRGTAIVGTFNVAIGTSALAMPPLGTASVAYTDGYALAVALTFVVTVASFWAISVGTRRS